MPTIDNHLQPDARRDLTLFNCCHEGRAPDWSRYQVLQLTGCIVAFTEDGEEYVESGLSADEAEFFGIYGIDEDGCAEAITDIEGADLATAEAVLVRLGQVSGLATRHHITLKDHVQ